MELGRSLGLGPRALYRFAAASREAQVRAGVQLGNIMRERGRRGSPWRGRGLELGEDVGALVKTGAAGEPDVASESRVEIKGGVDANTDVGRRGLGELSGPTVDADIGAQ